jgi:hypothetical protein
MGSGDKGYIVCITGNEHIETEVLWEMIRLSQKRPEVNYIMKSLISTHLHSTIGTTRMSGMKQCTKNW